MLRGKDHIRCAEQCIRAGRINHNIVSEGGAEAHLRTGGAADPVALLDLHALDVVHVLQIVQQSLGIRRDAEHPLALFLAHHGAAAALTYILYNLFVGKDALAGGAPVDRHFCLIGKPMLIKLEENPLRPLEVGRIRRIDLAIPVKAISQRLKLAPKHLDIVCGNNRRVNMVLDGIVFRRQAEGVIAHGEQDVLPLHPVLSGDHVHGRVGAGMADMQSRAGRIREFNQSIELFLF